MHSMLNTNETVLQQHPAASHGSSRRELPPTWNLALTNLVIAAVPRRVWKELWHSIYAPCCERAECEHYEPAHNWDCRCSSISGRFRLGRVLGFADVDFGRYSQGVSPTASVYQSN